MDHIIITSTYFHLYAFQKVSIVVQTNQDLMVMCI